MNRRGFFKRTIGALASAYLAPFLPKPASLTGIRGFNGPITFKAIPLVYDQYCPSNSFIFVGKSAVWVLDQSGTRKLGEVISIE